MTDSHAPWDHELIAALDVGGRPVSLEDFASLSGISESLLEVLTREGLLLPVSSEPEPLFDPEDVESIKAGLDLLGSGLPLAELLGLARKLSEAMQPIAVEAVEVFERFVRDSVEATSESEEEASERLLEAFSRMLPATGRLVDHHFRSLVIAQARRRLSDG